MQKHFRIFLFLSLLFLIVFTQSCRKTEETEALVFPDILLRDATYLLGRSDEEDILFKAKEIDIYIDDEKAELKDSEFEQKKEKSEDLLISGRADRANINTRTYESSLKGNVHLLLHEDNNSIDADEIVWDKDNGEIISNGSLTLNYGDVTVSGLDFKGNIKTGVFTFRTITSGVIKGEAPPEETPSTEELPPSPTETEQTPEISEETTSETISTEVTTPPTQEEQPEEPITPEIKTPEPEIFAPKTPTPSETQEEIIPEVPEAEETVQPETPELSPEETPILPEEEPEVQPTETPDIQAPTEEFPEETPVFPQETPSTAPEESYTELPEEIPSTDTSTEPAPPQTETPITEEPQEETTTETQEPPQKESTEEVQEPEKTEQNVQVPEETPKEIETFEPIVDIIVITRDGKIVE